MAKTLYLSDLDGTLLLPDATLSETSRQILRSLTEQDTLFTVATARTPYSVVPILGGLVPTVPGILMNGVLLYDFQEKRIFHAETIDPAAAKAVFSLLRQKHVTGFAYTLEQPESILRVWYENLDSPYRLEFYEERVGRYQKPFTRLDSFDLLPDQPLVYLSMMDMPDVLDPVAEELQNIPAVNFAYYRDIYNPGIWYLEIFSCHANKSHGVRRLRELCSDKYGFDSIIGFGDNLNDLPLFEACDQAYAVSNARPEVQEKANGTIGSNTEDAVANTIRSLEQSPDREEYTDNNPAR